MTSTQKGYAYMFATTFLVAVAYLCTDYVFRNFPKISPESAAFWGFNSASIIGLLFLVSSGHLRARTVKMLRSHSRILFIVSLLTSIGGLLWFLAMRDGSSGLISLLGKSQMLWAFLLGIFFLGERIRLRELPGLILALIGISLISTLKGELAPVVIGAMLTFALIQAIQSFAVKKYAPNVDGVVFAIVRAVLMTLFLDILLLIFFEVSTPPLSALIILAIGQICGLILARMFYFSAHNLLPISKLNIVILFDPILILFGTWLIFGDELSGQKLFSATLILSGLALFTREQFRLSKPTKVIETDLSAS